VNFREIAKPQIFTSINKVAMAVKMSELRKISPITLIVLERVPYLKISEQHNIEPLLIPIKKSSYMVSCS